MKNNITKVRALLLVIPFLVLIFFSANTKVNAANVLTEDQVFKAAPPGMKLDDYFQYPSSYKGTSGTTVPNSIKLLNNNEYPSDIVKMTGSPGQLASIWGKAEENGGNDNDGNYDYNYLDLSKRQTISGWMYFGQGVNTDGMAFVLQNDADGSNAIAKSINSNGTTPDTGESLGVWSGGGNPTAATTVDDYAKGAIQNSIAVEFDVHNNNDTITSKSNVFNNYLDGYIDRGGSQVAKGEHMAWNYPGDKSIYQQYSYSYTPFLSSKKTVYYYSMNSLDTRGNIYIVAESNDTIQTAWKHVTFNYYPPASGSTYASMSMAFGEKNYDGSIKPYREWDGIGVGKGLDGYKTPVSIDLSKLNLKSGQTKIRWGITATDGSYNTVDQPQAVIFESIPAVADILSSTDLYDLSQNRDIPDLDKDASADANVNDKDELRFDYSLNYDSGLIDTGDITTTMNLPKNVDFTPDGDGNIGQIVYGDKTVNIPSSALNSDGTAVNITLNSLSETNSSVKVELFGTAVAPDSTTVTSTTVDPAHTSYKSKHYTGDVMTPEFVINNEVLQISNTDSLSKTIKANESTQLAGTVSYQRGSKFDGKDLTVHTKVDGTSLSDGTLPVAADATQGDYLLSLSGSVLGVGDHKVEIYLTDSGHRISNPITYDVTVNPDNSLVITPTTDLTRTVNDNKSQTISGTFIHEDGTYLESGDRTVTYQVTNEGRTPQDPVTTTVSDDQFSFKLNPVAAQDGISNIDDFMADDNNYKGLILTEGKNTINVKVTDSAGHYGTITYVINVPKISPVISSKNLKPTITDVSNSNLFLNYEYVDNPDYVLGKDDLTFYEQIDNSSKNVKFDNPTGDVKTPYDIDPSISDALQGNTASGQHTLTMYGVDPYGRKTAEITYDITVLEKYLKLDVDDYKFQTINAGAEKMGYIHRSGNWDVNVTTFKSNWSLSATGGSFVQSFSDGRPSETLNGNMVFIKNNDTQNLDNTLIATGKYSGDNIPQTIDVSNDWGYNDGILLNLQSFNEPGKYNSTIKWDLVESV
ncbi:hypothetical protein [Companilactobacillus jidongensis]|uniref:hypothetical protein n=1 Tax=Companilactobacillus jidongensis TaxID=2486006 RepID=UPI000F776FCD|nr:hypothetical protein [Companilactobacillus jidongensis]